MIATGHAKLTNIILVLPIRVSLTIFNPLCIIATSVISVNEQYLLFLWVMCTYMSPFICKQHCRMMQNEMMSFDKMTKRHFLQHKNEKNAVFKTNLVSRRKNKHCSFTYVTNIVTIQNGLKFFRSIYDLKIIESLLERVQIHKNAGK